MKIFTVADSIYEKLCLFLSKLVEAEPNSSALGKTVKDAWGLIQNPENKANIKFLVEFGKYESCTNSFVVVKSFDHKKVMMKHTKQLHTRNIRPNWHMNKYKTEILDRSKRKSNGRAENDMKWETHSQDSK